MTTITENDALRYKLEFLLRLAVGWTGPGNEQGMQAAGLLNASFDELFAQRWADAMRAQEVKDDLWDGSMRWDQRYSLAELGSHGKPHEMAMDLSLADLGRAVDDLMALKGEQ